MSPNMLFLIYSLISLFLFIVFYSIGERIYEANYSFIERFVDMLAALFWPVTMFVCFIILLITVLKISLKKVSSK